jgi:hypothetical protein
MQPLSFHFSRARRGRFENRSSALEVFSRARGRGPSALLSLAAFSLIAGPSVDMMKLGKKAGYEMIASYLAKADVAHVTP